MASIEELKASSPQKVKGRLSKLEQSHLALISALEGRMDAIDAELGVSIFHNRVIFTEIQVDRIFLLAFGLSHYWTLLTYLDSGYKEYEGRLNNARPFMHKLRFVKHEPDGKLRDQITCIVTMLTARQVPVCILLSSG